MCSNKYLWSGVLIKTPPTILIARGSTVVLSNKTHALMQEPRDKIVEAQTLAQDATTQVSAMLNQDNLDPDQLEKLRDRLKKLTDVLTSINEEQA